MIPVAVVCLLGAGARPVLWTTLPEAGLFVPSATSVAVVFRGKEPGLVEELDPSSGKSTRRILLPSGTVWPVEIDKNGKLLVWVNRGDPLVPAGPEYASPLTGWMHLGDLFANGGCLFARYGDEYYVERNGKLIDYKDSGYDLNVCGSRDGNTFWCVGRAAANGKASLEELRVSDSRVRLVRRRSFTVPPKFVDDDRICNAQAGPDGSLYLTYTVQLRDVAADCPIVELPVDERPEAPYRQGTAVCRLKPDALAVDPLAVFEEPFQDDDWVGPSRNLIRVDASGLDVLVVIESRIWKLTVGTDRPVRTGLRRAGL